jgi:hypothetical protein
LIRSRIIAQQALDAAHNCHSRPYICRSANLFTDVLQVRHTCNYLARIARNPIATRLTGFRLAHQSLLRRRFREL